MFDPSARVNLLTCLAFYQGTALWHIYPAADADKIREFCYQIEAANQSKPPNKVVTVEDMKKQMDDPCVAFGPSPIVL